MNDGPMVAGSGTPPSLPSVGQRAGQFVSVSECGMAATMATSVLMLAMAPAPEPVVSEMVTVGLEV